MNKFDQKARTTMVTNISMRQLFLGIACSLALSAGASAAPSIARDWDEQTLSAIRIDTPHPPVQARNLFSLSACMYDAWAAYADGPIGYVYKGKHTAPDVAAARREAISYAAYRILRERYVYSKSAAATLANLDAHMLSLGYPTNNFSTDTSTPAGVGNSVYAAVSAWFLADGSRQLQAYADYPAGQGGYVPVNPPLATGLPLLPSGVYNVNRWQPLSITNAVDQNGFPLGPIQKFLGAQWLGVRPFALTRSDPSLPWIDPGPPPQLNGVGDEAFRTNVVELIRRSSELTPDDGVTMDISPASFGNNSLGANDGAGYAINPITSLPYAPAIVKRGDFARVLAEFWADGPSSETPPGHWNVLANGVADNPNFVKRIGGTGPVLDDLEWDVKVYFALNAAVHDAACAAWSLKRYYDGWRPITAIRFMGALGQSTDPNAPAFHPWGLPLVPGLIEIVTDATAAPGGHHEGLPVNQVVILAWPGQPVVPGTHSGVRWTFPDAWMPYQKANFVTPSFPGYISGHSTFSRSAAEVLAAITGSPYFPGGLASYTITNLSFEAGPTQPIQLQWATYFDAADQAGLSRIWGGIHPPVDDFAGRRAGAHCGQAVWALVQQYFGPPPPSNTPPVLQPIGNQTINQGASLSLTLSASDSDLPAQTLTFSVDAGSPSGATINSSGLFQWTPSTSQGPGVYHFTVRVTDSGSPNLSAAQAFTVTIKDTEPPRIVCPMDETVELTGITGASVNYSLPAVQDNVPGATIACAPPAGATFPVGSTTVRCIATDTSGNTSSCAFKIVVLGPRGLGQKVLGDLMLLRATLPNPKDRGELDQAIQALSNSLLLPLWINQNHLQPRTAGRVFEEQKQAVQALSQLMQHNRSRIPISTLQAFINRLTKANRLLALTAMDEAAGPSLKKLPQARKAFAEGDKKLHEGKWAEAIAKFGEVCQQVLPLSTPPPPPGGSHSHAAF